MLVVCGGGWFGKVFMCGCVFVCVFGERVLIKKSLEGFTVLHQVGCLFLSFPFLLFTSFIFFVRCFFG